MVTHDGCNFNDDLTIFLNIKVLSSTLPCFKEQL